ncbi:hypothetical protein L6R52_40245, partial [Myxococcota bacterium]|nr:hypothetical protein [Myxococcota bacterium]
VPVELAGETPWDEKPTKQDHADSDLAELSEMLSQPPVRRGRRRPIDAIDEEEEEDRNVTEIVSLDDLK